VPVPLADRSMDVEYEFEVHGIGPSVLTRFPDLDILNVTLPVQTGLCVPLSATDAESGTDDADAAETLFTVVRVAPLSSFSIVRLAVLCEPRIAPFVGVLSVILTVSSGSKRLSSVIEMLNDFATSPGANVTVPDAAT
jgi:hypothetical protein